MTKSTVGQSVAQSHLGALVSQACPRVSSQAPCSASLGGGGGWGLESTVSQVLWVIQTENL